MPHLAFNREHLILRIHICETLWWCNLLDVSSAFRVVASQLAPAYMERVFCYQNRIFFWNLHYWFCLLYEYHTKRQHTWYGPIYLLWIVSLSMCPAPQLVDMSPDGKPWEHCHCSQLHIPKFYLVLLMAMSTSNRLQRVCICGILWDPGCCQMDGRQSGKERAAIYFLEWFSVLIVC